VTGIVELRLGDETLWIRARGEDADVRDGPAPLPPDATGTLARSTFFALANGRPAVDRALRDGLVGVEGDRALLEAVLGGLRLPVADRAAA